ncbi:MAG: DNA polymerase III subunit gamma/tau [Candidatus Nealsonbacteria bacterium]|nr:DNA polymerase III subunit gamma/tau [Candidatus Nealsonbacteria bacterium]
MSLVLYRKYRPQVFSDIVGQEHVIQTLSNAVSSGIISHAYLFSGPRGSGKTTVARLLAKSLNCLDRKEGQFEPCNKCSSCLEILGNRSLDLIEIDAASHRGIDEMRELRDGIKFAPSKSKYKIFIIDESHQLTKEAANALLKTLEEPPSHAIFILATTEIHKMIPTIISRCQRFDFRKLTLAEIVKKLEFVAKKEGIKIEKPALELIALSAAGSVRDAESILGQVLNYQDDQEIKTETIKEILGLVEISIVSQFCDLLFEKKASKALNSLNELIEKGIDLQEFTKSLINYLRRALIFKIAGIGSEWWAAGLTKEELENIKKQSDILKEDELRKIIDLFLEAESAMKYSSIPQLPLELAIIEVTEE